MVQIRFHPQACQARLGKADKGHLSPSCQGRGEKGVVSRNAKEIDEEHGVSREANDDIRQDELRTYVDHHIVLGLRTIETAHNDLFLLLLFSAPFGFYFLARSPSHCFLILLTASDPPRIGEIQFKTGHMVGNDFCHATECFFSDFFTHTTHFSHFAQAILRRVPIPAEPRVSRIGFQWMVGVLVADQGPNSGGGNIANSVTE